MGVKQIANGIRKWFRSHLTVAELPQHVFIVGAQKAGTTSLHSYLAMHPMVIVGIEKELGFFHRDSLFNKGIESYRNLFPVRADGKYLLDSTPEYMYIKRSAERIYAFRRDAKIIMILREPVSRAFSAFNMYLQANPNENFRERLTHANIDARTYFTPLADGSVKAELHNFLDFEMAIINGAEEGEEPALIRRGIYAPQVERFFNLFGRENVLVLFSDDLNYDRERTVSRALAFVGLKPIIGVDYPPLHVREYAADTSGKELIRKYAGSLFEKDKQELKDKFDIAVPW